MDAISPIQIQQSKRAILLYIIFTLSFSVNLYSQGDFLIDDFNQTIYNASPSNWGCTQTGLGTLFFANYDGVTTYDGNTWSLMTINNNSACLSIASTSSNKIYVGLQNDFGFLSPNERGALSFHSLKDQINSKINLSPFYKIFTILDTAYFYSDNLIVKYSNGNLIHWISENGSFSDLFEVNNKVYALLNDGIYSIKAKNMNKLPNSEKLVQHKIIFLSSKGNKLLVGTHESGFFEYDKGNIKKISASHLEKIKRPVYTTAYSNNLHLPFEYALGTLGNGIVFIDKDFNYVSTLNEKNGLSSSVIKGLTIDNNYNLWSTMQEGVARIETSSPFKKILPLDDLSCTIFSIINYQNRIYIGTSIGLYFLENNQIHKISDLNTAIWDLITYKDQLIIGTDDGLYFMQNEALTERSDFIKVTKLYISKNKKLIIGHAKGVSLLDIDQPTLGEKTFNIPPSRYNSIMEDDFGNLWISSKFDGIYQIKNPLDSTYEIQKYNEADGLPDTNEIQIIQLNKKQYFTSSNGFYQFNNNTTTFLKDSSIVDYGYDINNVTVTTTNDLILSTKNDENRTFLIQLKNTKSGYRTVSIPYRRLPNMSIDAIYQDDSLIWIAGSAGLFYFNENIKKDYQIPYNTLIRQVSTNDSTIFYGSYFSSKDTAQVKAILKDQPDNFKPTLTYSENNITFQYSAAFYEVPENNQYSYYLENNDKGWSKWSTEHKKEYSNLSPGTYTFHVKSKNIYEFEGSIATYEFTILPPWYRTWYAYIGYVLLAGLLIWGMILAYTFRVRMQRQKLKLVVADRTFEVLSQKKEIEKQKSLLETQFEQIKEQRDNIQSKNLELSMAQRETSKANLALQELNNNLEKEVEDRTSRIKSMLEELQKTNKELDHFIYRASHDLKGPISRISGLTSLAKLEVADSNSKNYIDLIDFTANNMKSTLTKLTQVHDLMSTELNIEEVDFASLISSIRTSIKYLEKDAGVIKYKFDFDKDLTIKTDSYRLSIIIANLIENAIIYRRSSQDEHSIDIRAYKEAESLKIMVSDSGIGLKEDQFDKIFDMFVKVNDNNNGSGLGLYLTKLALNRLNGSISVQSKINTFTTFTVTLPLVPPSESHQ
ncbi:ATP-binding protein [Fulvivirga ligni]|uniref:ATP-binding protein n=1 Tax=Fulvivirga ligni TaxID=2904246 RepID=UPI001F17BE8A|nr:ATP-binding protein [Fulvivirga ligni]UII20629.1 ATP-binding protein [Fulvivirga ligni]